MEHRGRTLFQKASSPEPTRNNSDGWGGSAAGAPAVLGRRQAALASSMDIPIP